MGKQILEYYSNEDLSGSIEREGFDYYFTFYVNTNDIRDLEVRKLAHEYQQARKQLVLYLLKQGVDVEEELP